MTRRVGSWSRRTLVNMVGASLCLALFPAGTVRAAVPETGTVRGPDSAYLIGAGDALQLFVWKEAELTRDVVVRIDGKITVPLLGDVHAVGRTPEQLGQEITNGLKRYLAAPQVTLTVKESSASRFYVIGRVARPGVFPLGSTTTLLQALALSGGLLEFAKADRIIVVRQERGGETLLRVDYKKIEAGTEVAQSNIALRPGDTIVVP
jgi:polysaccharide biosynthesis/export protein